MLTTKDTKVYNLYYSIYKKYLEKEKLRHGTVSVLGMRRLTGKGRR